MCFGSTAYQITDLGRVSATSINNSGKIVGVFDTGEASSWGDISHAFLWQDGVMTDLGALPGDTNSRAMAINDQGQIVGESIKANNSNARAFIYSGDTMTGLGAFGGSEDFARAISNSGQIAGTMYNGAYHAFAWQNGQVTWLGALGGSYRSCFAYDINNSGQIVGRSTTYGSSDHAFLWHDGQMGDLGTLGPASEWSKAYGINDLGQVVGESGGKAFLWQDSVMKSICSLGIGSSASRISNRSQVIGTWKTSDGYYDAKGKWVPTPQSRPFLWEDGVATDINSVIPADAGWFLRYAQDINDLGQIVGEGLIDGEAHAYLLTPVAEPSSLIALLAGLGGLGAVRRPRVG